MIRGLYFALLCAVLGVPAAMGQTAPRKIAEPGQRPAALDNGHGA